MPHLTLLRHGTNSCGPVLFIQILGPSDGLCWMPVWNVPGNIDIAFAPATLTAGNRRSRCSKRITALRTMPIGHSAMRTFVIQKSYLGSIPAIGTYPKIRHYFLLCVFILDQRGHSFTNLGLTIRVIQPLAFQSGWYLCFRSWFIPWWWADQSIRHYGNKVCEK